MTAQRGDFDRPVTGPVSGARERLAAWLEEFYGSSFHVDALLPVVEALADERAAEVLEQAMREDRTTVAKLSPVEQLTCFLVKGEDLLARAASLRASSREETGRG